LYGAPLTPEQRSRSRVLTAGAWGDGNNWSASVPDERGQLTRLAAGPGHGIARIYKWTTLILGMKPNEEEYKVMGLSGYSRSRRHIEAVERVFFEALDFRDGQFTSDRPLVDSYFDLKNRLEGHRFDNIAAALQNWASSLTCAWAKHWLRQTARRGLCFSGGLSMNIKINGDLLNLPDLDWLSVPASGGDESICAGACFALAAQAGAVEPMAHAYLGERPQAEREHWSTCLANLNATKTDYALREGIDAAVAARLLAADCVIARCVDAAEFGARALGNRSILANPANPGNLKYINDAIKNRDFWMPFTPSILSEHANELLDNPKNAVSPYMTVGFATVPERRAAIAAAIHPGDFSARPQFVQRATNRGYWELIEEFRKITGIPALLNTSLNLHGEPMNYTLDDAIRTLHLSDLDFLLMPGDRMLYKRRAEARLEAALGHPSRRAANRDAAAARRYASQS
jgi:carbamoyltransferase